MANITERKQAVLAMEYLVRSMNDEELMSSWLMVGVPDGDIPYGSTDINDVDDYFVDDDNFASLMSTFLKCMSLAKESGGLYIDKVVSK